MSRLANGIADLAGTVLLDDPFVDGNSYGELTCSALRSVP